MGNDASDSKIKIEPWTFQILTLRENVGMIWIIYYILYIYILYNVDFVGLLMFICSNNQYFNDPYLLVIDVLYQYY